MVFPRVTNVCKRLARAASAACAGALTLYVFNIYPDVSFSSEVDWLTIDQVFDFQVPSAVITTGVVDALETYSNDWAEVVDVYTNQIDWSFLASAVTNTNWWATREWYGNTNVFYHVRTNESPLLSGDLNVAGLSPQAVRFAFDGSNAISHLQHGEPLPWLTVPSFQDYDLSSTDLPADNPFESANPLIRGLSPPSGWFLESLPNGALYDAVFGPWETEISHLTSYTFNGVHPFGYLSDLLSTSCDNLQLIIGDSRVSPRRLLALVFSLFNVFLIFRWWLWRLFLIWGIITGTSVPNVDSVSQNSENT